MRDSKSTVYKKTVCKKTIYKKTGPGHQPPDESGSSSQKDDLIRNGTFTINGLPSKLFWTTTSELEFYPGGRHLLILDAQDSASQTVIPTNATRFKINFRVSALSDPPAVNRFLYVTLKNNELEELFILEINNRNLYPYTRESANTFTLQEGDITITLSNPVINAGNLIKITSIELWLEPVA